MCPRRDIRGRASPTGQQCGRSRPLPLSISLSPSVTSTSQQALLSAKNENLQPQQGDSLLLDEAVQALEIRLIKQAMQQSSGNKSKAARLLGLSRQGLLKKIDRYQLAV